MNIIIWILTRPPRVCFDVSSQGSQIMLTLKSDIISYLQNKGFHLISCQRGKRSQSHVIFSIGN